LLQYCNIESSDGAAMVGRVSSPNVHPPAAYPEPRVGPQHPDVGLGAIHAVGCSMCGAPAGGYCIDEGGGVAARTCWPRWWALVS
jgi:hypothetical protein